METPPRPADLVVILHGFSVKHKKYESLDDAIGKIYPNAKVFRPKDDLNLLSFADPATIVEKLLRDIDEFWENFKEDKSNYRIVLIGHSTGALLAKKLYLVAHGEKNDPGKDLEDRDAKAWASNIERIILIAGVNSGWTFSSQLRWYNAIWFRILFLIAKVISWFGKETLGLKTKKGSAFVKTLNEQSRALDDRIEGQDGALTIQLLGVDDGVVSPEDNVEIVRSNHYAYLEMQSSDHLSILNMKGEFGEMRKRMLKISINGTENEIKKLEPRSLSLRLIKVLKEEFQFIHKRAPVYGKESVGCTIKLKEDESLTEKVWKTTLKKATSDVQDSDTEYIRPPLKSELSDFEILKFGRLRAWADPAESAGTEPELAYGKDLLVAGDPLSRQFLEGVLNKKIEQENLLLEEEWMADANLRPYTKGVLKKFKESCAAKSQHSFFWNSTDLKASDIVKYIRSYKEVNRLVLEDVYADYVLQSDERELRFLYHEMYSQNTNAICLSGGGIRSGTFALGVLQGLKENGNSHLKKLTYMSTVSGGGYTGGWLSAWLHQDGEEKVFEEIDDKFPKEPAPIRHLRQYSNYLTPAVGLFSVDTWTLFAIYLRNLLLNWMILIPLLAAFVTVPWFLVSVLNQKVPLMAVQVGLILGAILLGYSDYFTKVNPPILLKSPTPNISGTSRESRNQQNFLVRCLLPGCAAIVVWSISYYWFKYGDFTGESDFVIEQQRILTDTTNKYLLPMKTIAAFTGGFVFIEWLVFLLLELVFKKIPPRYTQGKALGKRLFDGFFLILAGTFSGVLLVLTSNMLPSLDNDLGKQSIYFICLAFPTFLFVVLFIGFIYEGLKSGFTDDGEREWTARYNGWFLIAAVAWLLIFSLVLYVPVFTEKYFKELASAGGILGYLTAYLGKNLKSKGDEPKASAKKSALMSFLTVPVIAFLALVVLLVSLSHLSMSLICKINYASQECNCSPNASDTAQTPFWVSSLLFGIMGIIGWGASRIIDSNQFSLHGMYRSRLIRGFLGAARPAGVRHPDPFMGFDESDNIYMGNLALKKEYAVSKTSAGNIKDIETSAINKVTKPFHVVNIALNLVGGSNLAWQERMAESFTVSPLHAGSLNIGYRNTFITESQKDPVPDQNVNFYGGKTGISLGTAMTISGAAASPNSGYHSSPLVTFFMTLFNLRLGAWLGNPGPAGDNSFHESSPKKSVNPILGEMFGLTDDQNDYVYLSDGGHFENLGLYEMALRRNRFIIVSDGSCDQTCELEDLGSAIRKIRIDMGIEIDFPAGFHIAARTAKANKNGKYWAVGRIRYPEYYGQKGDQSGSSKFGVQDGVLLYIKPGIYGDEPKDIFNYASVNKAFPHESTADQFFSESQFESYRALGAYAMGRVGEELIQEYGISITQLLGTGNWETDVIQKLNAKIK